MDLYPSTKPPSTVDIGLWAGDGDEGYLAALRSYFPRLYQEYRPDLVIYLAGADPYEKDQLGSLRLTKEGLRRRDIIVIGEARRLRLPVAVVLAEGMRGLADTVDIHLNTERHRGQEILSALCLFIISPGSPGIIPQPGR
jgi:acetoin utilization deacetylase AcuC-like enzyme